MKLGGTFPGGTIASGGVSQSPPTWSCHSGRDSPQEETPLTWARLWGRGVNHSVCNRGRNFLPSRGDLLHPWKAALEVSGLNLQRLEKEYFSLQKGLFMLRSSRETAAHRDFSWVGETSFCCAFLCFLFLPLLYCCPRKRVHWGVHRHRSYKPVTQGSSLQTEELGDILLWVYIKTECTFSCLLVLHPESLAKIFLSGLHLVGSPNSLGIPGSCIL